MLWSPDVSVIWLRSAWQTDNLTAVRLADRQSDCGPPGRQTIWLNQGKLVYLPPHLIDNLTAVLFYLQVWLFHKVVGRYLQDEGSATKYLSEISMRWYYGRKVTPPWWTWSTLIWTMTNASLLNSLTSDWPNLVSVDPPIWILVEYYFSWFHQPFEAKEIFVKKHFLKAGELVNILHSVLSPENWLTLVSVAKTC